MLGSIGGALLGLGNHETAPHANNDAGATTVHHISETGETIGMIMIGTAVSFCVCAFS
jgi:hypothetical protein